MHRMYFIIMKPLASMLHLPLANLVYAASPDSPSRLFPHSIFRMPVILKLLP